VEAARESALVFLDAAREDWLAGQREAALAHIGSAKAVSDETGALYRAADALEKTIRAYP
jgi:hypothetical protein